MLLKLFVKYLKLKKTERVILNRTLLWLISALFFVRLFPLKWFSKWLGTFRQETNFELNEQQYIIVHLFVKNLNRIKKALPWKVKCFEEAISAKKVLKKYGIEGTLYLGVDKEGKESLKAHAWFKCGESVITGEKGYKNYAIVGVYT